MGNFGYLPIVVYTTLRPNNLNHRTHICSSTYYFSSYSATVQPNKKTRMYHLIKEADDITHRHSAKQLKQTKLVNITRGKNQLHFSVSSGTNNTFNLGSKQNRCKTSKIRYQNSNIAKREMRRQQGWGASVCRVYQCPICKGFHLTSQYPTKSANSDYSDKTIQKSRKSSCTVKGYRGSGGVSWSFSDHE